MNQLGCRMFCALGFSSRDLARRGRANYRTQPGNGGFWLATVVQDLLLECRNCEGYKAFPMSLLGIYERLTAKAESSEILFNLGKVVQALLLKVKSLTAFRRRRIVRDYVAKHPVRKLQLGSGLKLMDGWLNTDCSLVFKSPCFLDVTRPFPIDDAQFDYVFTEHLIEHITFKEGQNLLRESFRVLKPGGKIRVACPDLMKVIGLYSRPQTPDQQHYIKHCVDHSLADIGVYNECFVINNAVRNWGHKFLYDEQTMKLALERVGFVDAVRCEVCVSTDPVLHNLESSGLGYEAKCFETIVMEARKPL